MKKCLKEMKEENYHNRKQCGYVIIIQALEENAMFEGKKKGLGFEVGSEPLPVLLAKRTISALACCYFTRLDYKKEFKLIGE